MAKQVKNIFADAINALATRDVSATNKARIGALALMVRDDKVRDLLTAANVDPARFNARALYATEKCIKIVHAMTRDMVSVADLNANAFAAIKSAIVRADADAVITRDDLRASISKDVKHDEARAIYRRNALLAGNTLNAQAQQICDMLRTLNVTREVSKNVFRIDVENPILVRAREALKDIAAV